jgi:hypothetical protein
LLAVGADTDGRYIYLDNGSDPYQRATAALYRYDHQNDSYATLASPREATFRHALAILNGKIYRIGGDTGQGETAGVEAYDIATASWGAVAPQPVARTESAAVASNGYIYTVGGDMAGEKTYRYDPIADAWDDAAITDLPAAPIGPVAADLNGRLVVAGGLEGPSPGRTWVLDLAAPTGPWVETTTMPLLRFDAGGAALGGSLFSIGGASNTAYWTEQETQQYTEGACPPPTASPTATVPPSATLAAPTLTPAPNSPTPTATAPPPSPSATPCALGFSDVRPSDYFYAPAQYLACHGVISGYSDGTFRPYAGTTRAQMVKIVTLAFSVPPATPPAGGTFADVPPSHPFFAAVETAAARTLVSGYACGAPAEPCDSENRPYFRPYAPVTRGQLAKIVVVAAGWAPRAPAAATFADVAPGSAFYGFVETAVCRGVLSGYACGTAGEPCDARNRPYFRPGAGATRGQIAKIVYNAVAAPAPCAP